MKVVVGGMQLIESATSNEIQTIKEDLTLTNPAYTAAKRYSSYRYTSIPQHLYYFSKAESGMLVPRGYHIPFNYSVEEDNRCLVFANYPRFKMSLRATQREAFIAWRKNTNNGVIVLPTGKGKTVEAIYMASKMRQKTLVIVQKDDLISGWKSDIWSCLEIRPKKIGLIKAGVCRIGEQITLATVQTLSKLSSDVIGKLYSSFGMVIVDEFHHSAAKTYEIVKYFQARYLIGLTATDDRGDGLKEVLYWYFGNVAYRFKEVADDPDIMPYKVIVKDSDIEYDPPDVFMYRGQEVTPEEAEELREAGKYVKRKPISITELHKLLVGSKSFNRMVTCDIFKEYKLGKSCVAFLHEKEHICQLRDRLIEAGIPENQIQLYYGDAVVKDEVMKKQAESKEVLITLATYAKATEGTNVKAWERAFLVSSVNSEKNVIQAIGRVRRCKEGKDSVIVYDYNHPKAVGLKHHLTTRLRAYKMTNANVVLPAKSKSSGRGFNCLK